MLLTVQINLVVAVVVPAKSVAMAQQGAEAKAETVINLQ
jgi:hypothetical protein